MKAYVPIMVVVGFSLIGVYFFMQNVGNSPAQSINPACNELSSQEVQTIATAFLKKKGYTENYDLTDISPLYCDNGIGTRNMIAQGIIDEGLPTQHNKTIRLQMRTDANEMKIYEVVLTNPT